MQYPTSMLGLSIAAKSRREPQPDDLGAEMGRTLDDLIASLPKAEREQIDAQYQALRRDYLKSKDHGSADEAKTKTKTETEG
jgi:hypothetical protein